MLVGFERFQTIQFFDNLIQVVLACVQEPVFLEKFQVGGVFGVMDLRVVFKILGKVLCKLEVGGAVFGLDYDSKASEAAKSVFDCLVVCFDFVSLECIL